MHNEHGRSCRPARWKRAAVASALGVVIIAFGLAMAAPASAGVCSSKTGGSSDTLIWTGSTYTCAYIASNGNKSIKQLAAGSWTSSTAKGYTKRANTDKQSGGVTITYIYTNAANTGVGSSITYSAYNASSGSRHWTACVLWNAGGSAAGNQYITSCNDNYNMPAILMYISKFTLVGPASVTAGQKATFTATVTAPDGGGPPAGTVVFYQSTSAGKSPVKKDCSGVPASDSGTDVALGKATLSNGTATLTTGGGTSATNPAWTAGTYYIYAVYAGMPTTSEGYPSYCMTPPQRGLTPAIQDNTLTVAVN